MSERLEWEMLSPVEQDKYRRKAQYLINYHYVEDKDSEALAKKIYDKETKSDE